MFAVKRWRFLDQRLAGIESRVTKERVIRAVSKGYSMELLGGGFSCSTCPMVHFWPETRSYLRVHPVQDGCGLSTDIGAGARAHRARPRARIDVLCRANIERQRLARYGDRARED